MFRAASLPHFRITAREPAEVTTFYVHAVTYQMPRMILTRVRGGPIVMHRGAAEIASDPHPPVLTVHIQLSGDSDGKVAGRTLKTRPGDVLFFDYAREIECSNTALECITLLLSRDQAHASWLHPAAHGALLSGDSGPAPLVAAAARETHALLDKLTVPQADLARQSLCDLAGRMLEDHLAAANERRGPASTLSAALSFIDGRLDDDALSASKVARHLGLSRSAMYRIFEPIGGVDTAIRHRRLDRAMRAILTGNAAESRTARAGFKNEEQFARAFQARFGARPARYQPLRLLTMWTG